MSASFTPELKKVLSEAGYYLQRQGDHEIWYSPNTVVPKVMKPCLSLRSLILPAVPTSVRKGYKHFNIVINGKSSTPGELDQVQSQPLAGNACTDFLPL